MILENSANKKSNIKIKYANTFFKRFKGLMGKKDIDFGLLFSNLNDSSVHTMFMRFDIDVYFIDEKKIIFEKTTLNPWKFYRPKKRAHYILETKKDELKLKKGDKLEFI